MTRFVPMADISVSVFLVCAAMPVVALDWPCWRGPERNGISSETGWRTSWPATGPTILWRANIGTGFSSVSVSNGRVYAMGNRRNEENIEADHVYCFDAATGKLIWQFNYPCRLNPNMYEGGPSATPTVEDGRVYTLGREGHLHCLDAADGTVIWRQHPGKATGAKAPEWGFASSPLIEGNLVIVNVGTAGTALNKRDGKVVWTTGKEQSGFSSPVLFDDAGQKHALMFGFRHLYATRISDGQIAWRYPWQTQYDINAADQIVVGSRIFLSSAYGHGAALLDVKGGKITEAWTSDAMRNQLNSSVLWKDHLYGVDCAPGDKNGLRCVDWKTGQSKWFEPSVGRGSLMLAGGRLVVLSDQGELIVADATPQAFRPLARAKILDGKCWTVPVLANGRIYARNAAGDLICIDVRGGGPSGT